MYNYIKINKKNNNTEIIYFNSVLFLRVKINFHSFFSKCFILVRVPVNLKPILVTLGQSV